MSDTTPVWGIDVGRRTLKAIRLDAVDEQGRVRLGDVQLVEHRGYEAKASRGIVEFEPTGLARFVAEHVGEHERAYVSVPAEAAVTREITLPAAGGSRVREFVGEAFAATVPIPLDELDWAMYAEEPVESATAFHVFGHRRAPLESIRRVFESADRTLGGLQLASVAAFNAIVGDRNLAEKARARRAKSTALPGFAILDMGTETTNLVVTDGLSFWSHVIRLGGRHFTRAIADGLEVDYASAEAIKTGRQPIMPFQLVPVLKDVYQEFVAELQRAFGNYLTTRDTRGINRVICLGDAFGIRGLTRFLEQQLQRETAGYERFIRIPKSQLSSYESMSESPSRYAIAYGLALQGFESAPISGCLSPSAGETKSGGLAGVFESLFGRTRWRQTARH